MFYTQKVVVNQKIIDIYQENNTIKYHFAHSFVIIIAFCTTFAAKTLQCDTKDAHFKTFLRYEKD